MNEMSDIVLFKKYAFHGSCIDPISIELHKLGIDHTLTSKRHLIYDRFEETMRRFKIMVIADEWSSLFRDIAETLMTTGHSLVSKNTTLDYKNEQMDYICVPSELYQQMFMDRNIKPIKDFWITGFPAADKVFRNEISLDTIWAEELEDSRPKILFAPTYNKDLSIMEALIQLEKETNFFKLFGSYSVVFKLHPVLYKKYPHQAEFVEYLTKKYSFIRYHDDSHSDIADAIVWADIMIGDCSGALLLSAAGGCPVIAYDNPNRERSEYYDPNGPEWAYRDEYAYRINGFRELNVLPGFIDVILNNDYGKIARNNFNKKIHANPGKAAKTIAKNISSLL